MPQKQNNIIDVLPDLQTSQYVNKVNKSLSEAVNRTLMYGKQSKVTIELKIDKSKDTEQVVIQHKVASVLPTFTGKVSEEDTTQTPFYTTVDNILSLTPPSKRQERIAEEEKLFGEKE